VLRIRVAHNGLAAGADALRRAVSPLASRVGTVQLLEHGVINVSAEGILDRRQIRPVAVRGELHPIAESPRQIRDERKGGPEIASPNQERSHQLGVSIDRRPV